MLEVMEDEYFNNEPYRDLIVWQRADEFIQLVYRAVNSFPSEEKFGITSQLKRAAVSVALNIVEGQARGTPKDFVRMLYIARGSITECAYLLELSRKQKYLNHDQFNKLESKRREVSYLLQRTISGLK